MATTTDKRDGPIGLVPATECKKFAEYPVSPTLSSKIYKGAPLMLLSGVAVPYDENNIGVGPIIGVATHHVNTNPGAGATVIVTDDPEMEFYISATGDTYTGAAFCGLYGGFLANGTSNGPDDGLNDTSICQFDLANAGNAAPTAVYPCKVLGIVEDPVNEADNDPVIRIRILDEDYF